MFKIWKWRALGSGCGSSLPTRGAHSAHAGCGEGASGHVRTEGRSSRAFRELHCPQLLLPSCDLSAPRLLLSVLPKSTGKCCKFTSTRRGEEGATWEWSDWGQSWRPGPGAPLSGAAALSTSAVRPACPAPPRQGVRGALLRLEEAGVFRLFVRVCPPAPSVGASCSGASAWCAVGGSGPPLFGVACCSLAPGVRDIHLHLLFTAQTAQLVHKTTRSRLLVFSWLFPLSLLSYTELSVHL